MYFDYILPLVISFSEVGYGFLFPGKIVQSKVYYQLITLTQLSVSVLLLCCVRIVKNKGKVCLCYHRTQCLLFMCVSLQEMNDRN